MLVALVAGAVLLAASWLERNLSARGVAARLGEQLGREVRIDSLRVHFAPWLRVRLEGVSIGDDLRAPVVEVGPDLMELLAGRLEVARVEIEGAELSVTRFADGAFGLGEVPFEGGPASALPDPEALPELELRDLRIDWVDRAVRAEPVRIGLDLDDVSFVRSLLGSAFELVGRLGEDGGGLRLTASTGLGARVQGSVLFESLDTQTFSPYLLAAGVAGPLEIAGRIDGEVRLEGAALDGLDGRLSMRSRDLQLDVAEARLHGPAVIDATVSRGADSLRLGDVRLALADLRLPGAATSLSELEVLADGFELGSGESEFAANEVALTYESGGVGRRLHVERVVLEAREAGLALEASLGPERGRTPLALQATLRGAPEGTPAAERPLDVLLRLDPTDAAEVAPWLPESWGAETREARLEGEADLAGSLDAGLRGAARLSLGSGALGFGELSIDAPASLEGRIDATRGGFALEGGALDAAAFRYDEYETRGVRARLRFDGAKLEVEEAAFDRYDGPLVLAEEGRTGPELQVLRAAEVRLFGSLGAWPHGARVEWLRIPSRATLLDAHGTIQTGGQPEPIPVRFSRLEIEDYARGRTARLGLRAELGDPPASSGTLRVDGTRGPLGEPDGTLQLDVTASGLDPQLIRSELEQSFTLGGEPGPLDVNASLEVRADGSVEARGTLSMQEGSLGIDTTTLQAPLGWSGRVELRDGDFGIRSGRLTATGMSIGTLEASDLLVDHALSGTRLELAPMGFRVHGGSVQQSGWIRLETPPRFEVSMRLAELDALALAGLSTSPDPPVLSGRADLAGVWHGSERWLEELTGEGELTLRGGTLPAAELVRVVWNALVRRVPAIGSRREAGVRRATELHLARLPFEVGDRRVRTQGFTVGTEDYDLELRGALDAEMKLDLDGVVRFTSQGIDRLLRTSRIPSRLRSAFQLPSIPIQMRGPLRSPSIQADVARVPLATVEGLLRLPGRATGALRPRRTEPEPSGP